MKQKVLIVGGVAGGAGTATRLRRLDEEAEIIVFERGNYVSFANCGLPYYIGDTIKDREDLLLQTPKSLHDRFNIDVRVMSEVTAVDAAAKTVTVRERAGAREYKENYDKLVLSPGAEPVRPRIEGIDLPGVYTIRNIPDTFAIRSHVDDEKPKRAIVVGGGFIGVEMAENLTERGVDVTLVEFTNQVVPPLDIELAAQLHKHMRDKKVKLELGKALTAIRPASEGSKTGELTAELSDGSALEAGMIILAVGVRPDTRLAASAGLKIGERGGIWTDDHLRTSDPNIYALGDAVEVIDFVTGQSALIPLAGPANKQARIAAENIAGRDSKYEGTQGTSVLKIFDMSAATVGANEKTLKRLGIPYEKVYVNPGSHASYYPGSRTMTLKLIFAPETGKILGAQAVGDSAVVKRIDVIATVQRLGGTVFDLEKLELAYAPPYSSAKDPVNMAGFVAGNVLRGDHKIFHWNEADTLDLEKVQLVDVRTPSEFKRGHIEGAVNIPLDSIRKRKDEFAADKPIYLYCQVGLRGYFAVRLLDRLGFGDARNMTGGYYLYNNAKQ